jgi:hypothetical protein
MSHDETTLSAPGVGVAVFTWIGRGLALLLFLFWGAFLVEHVSEWFLHPAQGLPPARVWVAMLFHLAMLVGLLLMLKWDRVGSAVTLVATVAFFAVIGMNRFPYLALLNLVPLPFFAAAWLLSRHGPR